jgi:diadenosine tetraphosphate (Ap4A) HIT family hydrolase
MANATETKFGDPANRLFQTDAWTVLLRPKQPTLGSLVLVCREPVRSLADLSPHAYSDLRGVVRRTEVVLREFVAFDRINYLMLMMVDPDVHYHVVPRYAGTRRYHGLDFPDAGWPGVPALDVAIALDAAAAQALAAQLRDAFARASE